ncbi:uncharacterized protein misp3 [Larimichthys crocea]|uniref:uncharacterized protein misp3 n=1 Tax=Larimichthys crocea TaxID=215358 RepID=UPI000F5FB074|nr:uncharacterized protein LOC109140893 [Larimichthys crocea]
MATKPAAWQEPGPVNSSDGRVNERRARGEVDAIISCDSKRAPRAEPEEDVDVQEPETLAENQQTPSGRSHRADAAKLEDQESTRINLSAPRETRETVTELEQVAQLAALKTREESVDLYDSSPPPFSASSTEEFSEKGGFCCLEWISDAEVISEGLTSPDGRNRQELTEPIHREEMTGDNTTTEEDVTPLNASPAAAAGFNPTHPSPSDSSDDVYTLSSPPFADESEEEEEVSTDVMSSQQQCCEPLHSPAVPSSRQQKELLTQSQCEFDPEGAKQEAAQQVLGQHSPPVSTVAMEPSNQGGAASQGCGCVLAVRERQSRAGGRTQEESQQTGGEGGQREGGLKRNKAAGQQHGGEYSETVQILPLETEEDRSVSSEDSRMEGDSCDDNQSDSGVSADFSPCSTLEANTTISTGSGPKETPIEREIRRAVEREHSLRRARGLPNPPKSPEYVEIPLRKSVLNQSVPERLSQGKDRQLAGKKMQHEIYEEIQREQDLVRLGKIPGFYDKGSVRLLKEKKELFEAFQKPDDSTLPLSPRSKLTSWSSAGAMSTIENQEDISSPVSILGGSYEGKTPTQNPRDFSETNGCQIMIIENNLSVPGTKLHRPEPEAEPVTVVDSGGPNISSPRTGGHGWIEGREQEREEEEEAEVRPKQNPFFKLRPSTNVVKVEQEIREAEERERELKKQRMSLYGGMGRGGGRGQANVKGKSPTSSPSMNGLAVPDSPGSSYRRITGPPAVRQSVGKLGMWPPAQAEEGKINQPESPRTPRQKNPLVLRWESGLINGHHEEDD